MRRYLHFLLALVLFFTGYALAQTTLGKMFQLGQTTTAGRPTPSTTAEGSLLYDTDLDQPIYSTSTSWSPVSYWTNGGGTGTIQPIPGISTVQSTARVGTNSFALLTNGARLDVGSGTNDYIFSDGVGLYIPTALTVFDYVAASERGLVLSSSTGNFPAGGAQSYGHLYYHSAWAAPASSGSVFLFDGNGWGSLGRGKNYGAQKKAMYLETSVENTAPHTMRLPVLIGSGVSASWVCSDAASATSTVVNGRPFRVSNTTTTAGSSSYCHTGTVAGTVDGVTRAQLESSVCAWVYLPTVDNVRIWWGFTNSISGLTSDTPTTANLAAVRYSTTAGDSRMQLVVCDGTSCSVTSSDNGGTSGSTLSLCVDMSSNDGYTYLFIHRYGDTTSVDDVVRSSTTPLRPGASSSLGVFYYVEAATVSAVGFGVSNIAMESN